MKPPAGSRTAGRSLRGSHSRASARWAFDKRTGRARQKRPCPSEHAWALNARQDFVQVVFASVFQAPLSCASERSLNAVIVVMV